MPEATFYRAQAISPVADRPATGGRLLRLAGVSALLLFVFSVVEHDPIFANSQISKIDETEIRDEYIEQIEEGSILRQVALLSFGAFGVFAVANCRSTPWNPRWSVLLPLVLLVTLCFLSMGWSGQPFVTFKRLVILGCVLAGCAGIARMLTPREFLLVSLVTLTIFIGAAVVIDLAAGGRPWAGGDYRFGGTLHPNAQAAYCGILCLATVCQPIGFGRRWILRLLFVLSMGLILLTQSRTGLMSVVMAIVATWTIRLPSGLKWAGISALVAAGALAFIAYFSVGDGARNSLVDAALLGRTEQSGSLTGRVPLWEELLKYASDRPAIGYGYEGFWTQDRIAAIMKSQRWTMQNAHNSYLEVVMQLGFVGLALMVWFLASGVSVLGAANRLTRDPGYAFAFGVVVFGLFNSTLESLFAKIRYSPAIALTGLLMVALYYPLVAANGSEAAREEPSPVY